MDLKLLKQVTSLRKMETETKKKQSFVDMPASDGEEEDEIDVSM